MLLNNFELSYLKVELKSEFIWESHFFLHCNKAASFGVNYHINSDLKILSILFRFEANLRKIILLGI